MHAFLGFLGGAGLLGGAAGDVAGDAAGEPVWGEAPARPPRCVLLLCCGLPRGRAGPLAFSGLRSPTLRLAPPAAPAAAAVPPRCLAEGPFWPAGAFWGALGARGGAARGADCPAGLQGALRDAGLLGLGLKGASGRREKPRARS